MLLFKDFFPPEVITLVTDRSVDFTLKENQKELEPTQKQYLSAQLDIEKIFNIRQVHEDTIVIATKENFAQQAEAVQADAVITQAALLPIGVRTADCLPIFMYDPVKRCAAMVHAGWRGSRKEIVVKTANLMQKEFGVAAKNVLVAFGPSIRSCCYQVGKEFEEIFPEEVGRCEGSLYLDLPAVNRRQVKTAGVNEKNIFDVKSCTCCDQRFFSFRRDKEKAGRHLSLLMIRE